MSKYEICVSVMEPFDPREKDNNVGQIVTPPSPYKYAGLGDYSIPADDLTELAAMYEANGFAYAPVYVLDHSCIRISTKTFNDPWDESHIGFIFGDTRAYLESIGGKRMSKKRHEELRELLDLEIQELDEHYNVEHYEASIWIGGDFEASEIFFDSEESAQEWAEDYIARL